MTCIFSHPDPAIAHLVRNALEQIGVPVIVQGDRLGAALGEVPPISAWVEVWVPDEHVDDARSVVAEAMAEPDTEAEPWTCTVCGEVSDAQFGACWSCGAPAPEAV